MKLDLSTLPQGQTYEDRYQGYLDVFKRIADVPTVEPVTVVHPPWSWVPLLGHMGCEVMVPRHHFPHCKIVERALLAYPQHLDRTMVEVLCGFRTECVDALWKCDMQWRPGRVVIYRPVKEFIVTNNGSFHRPEVLIYGHELENYVPSKRKVLLVPCAADKPYPSPMHQACLDILPNDFYLANATGVLGIVPQDLWPVMPHYDSGIPNQWRLFEIARKYFERHKHDRIVVYCDFYSETLWHVFQSLHHDMMDRVDFVLPVQQYADYVDLMNPRRLRALQVALRQ